MYVCIVYVYVNKYLIYFITPTAIVNISNNYTTIINNIVYKCVYKYYNIN